MNNYSQAIKYLNSFINYERIAPYSYQQALELQRFRNFLESIDNPQLRFKVIHVAGTKGKGSTCAFIAYILKEAGFKVGLYTSPHLNDFRERIRVLWQIANSKWSATNALVDRQMAQTDNFEGMISKKEIRDLVTRLKPRIDKFNRNSQYGQLTLFEVCTALAYEYFKEKNVDFVVLETGLGGRLDATNVCSSLISVITAISLEHTYLLGKTIEKIAFEKASIIKKENRLAENGKRVALSARQDKTAMAVVEKLAKENKAILLKEGRNFKFEIKRNNIFDYKGSNSIENLKINLIGAHQIANASLAIAAVEALRYYGVDISKEAIKRGLKNCFWPARFEIVSRNPIVILDGAQNSASVRALYKTIKENFPRKQAWLIFGIAKDKELKDTCSEAEKITKNIILTKADNLRASEPKDLLKYFSTNSQILTQNSQEALNVAKSRARKDDVILVTGSLYVCGEVKAQIKRS